MRADASCTFIVALKLRLSCEPTGGAACGARDQSRRSIPYLQGVTQQCATYYPQTQTVRVLRLTRRRPRFGSTVTPACVSLTHWRAHRTSSRARGFSKSASRRASVNAMRKPASSRAAQQQ